MLCISINRWRIEFIAADIKGPGVQHTMAERRENTFLRVDGINDCIELSEVGPVKREDNVSVSQVSSTTKAIRSKRERFI